MDSPRYERFNVSKVTYKVVHGHEIHAYILVPKNLPKGKHPLIIKFHGGGSVTGSGIFPDWFAIYLLDLAVQENAIVVSPNYRLLPESTATEMVSDMNDFWTWVRTKEFSKHLPAEVVPDHEHTLVYGESAGGHLANLTALTQPTDYVRAVIAAYPQTDIEDKYYNEPSEKHPFGFPILPRSTWDDHVATIHPDPAKRTLVSDVMPFKRMPLILSALQHGRFKEIFGDDSDVYPLRVLEKVPSGEKRPFLFLMHGEKDGVLAVDGTTKFKKAWEKKFGAEGVILHVEPDADHGFDCDLTLKEGPEWLKDGIRAVKAAWLQ
ncbi:Alpha beta hydrolase fold-1 protein [Rutstroemia sp. NJR-2017a WRK4]|nr:Alpha beta hydrolase fold-1 protein [Rutstroemia sp. NJR-2017a WRK4]